MKKAILLFTAITMSLATTFVACKKDQQIASKPAVAATTGTHPKSAARVSINVTVSDRGFLVFNAVKDVDEYVAFLVSSTLSDVNQFHADLGFSSLAGNKYANLDQGSMVTEDQLKDFMLDAQGLMEINGTVFKSSDDNAYLLTMQADQLNDETYNKIAANTFDRTVMNRFATKTARASSFDLFNAIAIEPSGISEEDPGGVTTMKFWGRDHGCHPCYQIGNRWYKNCYTTYYRCFMAYTDNETEFMIPC